MMLQEQSQIKAMAKTARKTVARKQTCMQSATFESCGARTNKGVTDLNIECERQKLDQTDVRNMHDNVSKTYSFLVTLQQPQTWLANIDRFPAFVSRRRKI